MLSVAILDYQSNSLLARVCKHLHRKAVLLTDLRHCPHEHATERANNKKGSRSCPFIRYKKKLSFFQHARHSPRLGLGERAARFDFDQIAHFGGAGFVVGVVFL